MDELNKIIGSYFDEIGYSDVDDFNDVKKMAEVILSVREPRFLDKIKNRFGINKSIELAYEFFDDFDIEYGDYFIDRLRSNSFIFKKVNKNSPENPYSYFDRSEGRNMIFIPFQNDICDSFALVHETFHDTNLDINNLNITRNIFTEYISMFGEFLLEDFVRDNYDIKCKANNNYSFNVCFIKALKVDFQINLIKCYLEKGSLNKFYFNSIINEYDKKYHGLLYQICYRIINDKNLNFDYEMRYLYGILLSCYSYDKLLNNDFDIDIFKYLNANINYLYPEEFYDYLGLDVIDDYNLLLSPESYDKLGNSYVKVMNNR